ncbi:acyl-CoA dehydrogenase family protein [Escherichia coli]
MERLINAARSTGFAECAFEDAARYANQRIAFGKPIGHNQMIQEKLALMAIKIDNMRNMVLKWHGKPISISTAYQRGAGKTVLRTYRNGSH